MDVDNKADNEVPWSRGKREVEAGEDSFCVLVQPDERTTGKFELLCMSKNHILCSVQTVYITGTLIQTRVR